MKISCIDIGGTYIKSGVLEDGVLTDVEETPTDGGGGARAMLSRVAQPGGRRRAWSVGVSTAGEVDARTGVIRLSDNIPGYTGLNPRQIPEGELGLPVAVENDGTPRRRENSPSARRGTNRISWMVSYGTGCGRRGVYRRPAVPVAARAARGVRGLVTHPEAVGPGAAGHGSYERYASTSALVARVTALYPALTTDGIFLHI